MVQTGTSPKLAALCLTLALLAGGGWYALARGGAAGEARKPSIMHATTSNLAQVFADAKGGETIRLAPGDYGKFRGGVKQSMVTLRPRVPGTVTMTLALDGSVGVAVEGMVLRGAEISGAARHIRVAHNRFTGPVLIRADRMAHADVVFEANRHPDIDVCDGCFEGRLHVTGDAGPPSGITIRRSRFGPGGNADGIQTGGDGVRILDNEFVAIHESGGVHTDAIQLYGSSHTLVRGNWIHETSTGIVAPDGADHEVIEQNVIAPESYPFAIAIGSDNGSVIRHNTLPPGACAFNLRCGIVSLGGKDGQGRGHGTVVEDNVLSEVSVQAGATVATERHNLVGAASTAGTADLSGEPIFAGGADPSRWRGFRLADDSLGRGAASDGTDIGISP